jgi:hypothetical protein
MLFSVPKFARASGAKRIYIRDLPSTPSRSLPMKVNILGHELTITNATTIELDEQVDKPFFQMVHDQLGHQWINMEMIAERLKIGEVWLK